MTSGPQRTDTTHGQSQSNRLNRKLPSHPRRRNRLGIRSPKARGNHRGTRSLLQTQHLYQSANLLQLKQRLRATRGALKMLMITQRKNQNRKRPSRNHLGRRSCRRRGNHQEIASHQRIINWQETLHLLVIRKPRLQQKRRFQSHKMMRVMIRRSLRLITILNAYSLAGRNE